MKVPKLTVQSNPAILDQIRKSSQQQQQIETPQEDLLPKSSFHHFIRRYFSLEPTWPQTWDREFAYYRSTITHGILVHGGTGVIGALVIASEVLKENI